MMTLPSWSAEPGSVDRTGATHLIVCIGADPRAAATTAAWAADTDASHTRTLALWSLGREDDAASYRHALSESRTGVRIMIAGGQFDVLTALATARDHGAIPAELSAHVVDVGDLGVYCVHCRATFRAEVAPGECTTCPGCRRTVEVLEHYASAHGSYLATDARAYDID